MKNIHPKKYARALYELIGAAHSEEHVRQIVANFLRVVEANRDTAQLNAIVAALADLYDEAAGTVHGTLVTAREVSPAAMTAVKQEIAAMVGAKTIEFHYVVDESLLGGFKAMVRDRVIDASVRGHISALKHTLLQ